MKKNTLLILFLVLSSDFFAQCAMCKTTAESSGMGGGLNNGILYLMFIPYLLLGAFVLFVLRKKIALFYKDFRRKSKQKDYTIDNWY